MEKIIMKTNSIFLLIFILATFTNLALAETYSYEIEEVESLEVSTGVEFNVWCGDENKLEIFADSENDFQMLLKDKRLEIKSTNKNHWLFFSWGRNNDVTADITLKNPPKFIELSTGSQGRMQNCSHREADLNLSTSTGSSLKIDSGSDSINQLEVDLSTGSVIEIEGKLHINHLKLNASTGSIFEADNEVIIETSKVSMSTGALADICGVLEISGKVSTGGIVGVAENTIRTKVTTSSGGEVDVDC
jgi:hypothetical protein